MPAWIPLVSAGLGLGQSLFGRKQSTEYQMSPEQRAYIDLLYGELEEPTPSYLTSPIIQQFAGLKQGIREEQREALGPASGLAAAQLMGATTAQGRVLGEVGEKYRADLLRMIGGAVGGTGIRETTMPFDPSASLEDIGWALFMATQDKKKKQGEVTYEQMQRPYGGGMQYSPGFLGG